MAGTSAPSAPSATPPGASEPAGSDLEDLRRRVARLEQALRLLEARAQYLERFLSPRAENPSDDAATRRKVTYDWQA